MSDFNYRGKLPFRIITSSVDTGYNAQITSAVGYCIELVNLHKDEYGDLQDHPAQGPFTEKWVGGHQHRHISLNDGNNDSTNRPEAFLISGSTGKIHVFGTDYFDSSSPRAIYTRDNISKSPLNIKNIKTQNGQIGNFSHNYQVVQTSGRDINENLIENNLTASGVLTTKFIKFPTSTAVLAVPATVEVYSIILFTAIVIGNDSGNSRTISLQYNQPSTNVTEIGNDIFINSTLDGIGVNKLSVLSIMSILSNVSNWLSGVPKCIAGPVIDLTTKVSAFSNAPFSGGIDGVSGGEPLNIYSLPEEPKKTKSVFVERFSAPGDWKETSRGALDRESEQYAPNNSLVTRNITARQIYNSTFSPARFLVPNSDLRYQWIKESDAGTDPSLVFQSFAGSYNRKGAFTDISFNESISVLNGVVETVVDNLAINSLIKDKKVLDLESNTLSFKSNQNPGLLASFSEISNTAYQFSTWRQIRNLEHPVVKNLTKNNVISLEGNKFNVINSKQINSKRSNSVKNYVEAPAVNKHKPLVNKLKLKGSNQIFSFVFTHANNLTTFANQEIIDKLGIDTNLQQTHDLLNKFYTDRNRTANLQNPFENLQSLIYSETVYPRQINAYLAETRARTDYILTQSGTSRDGYDIQLGKQRVFWRDSVEDRKRSVTSFINSMNYLVTSKNFTLQTDGEFKFVNTGSLTPDLGNYQVTQSFKSGTIYLDSIHEIDNNINNNENRFISDTVVFISASESENGIFTKQLDNGNSGEINGEIFLDYSYSDIKRAIPAIPSTTEFIAEKTQFAADELAIPEQLIVVSDDPGSSNLRLVEIMDNYLDAPPNLLNQIQINYNATQNAIYAIDGDPTDCSIDITGSTYLVASELIDFINNPSNWISDPSNPPTIPVVPLFYAEPVSILQPLTTPIYWTGVQYFTSGTPPVGIVDIIGSATVNFTFIPLGNDSGNGWTVELQNNTSSIIDEIGQDIIINVTSTVDNTQINSASLTTAQLVSFVNNSLNWSSGIPKFTASTLYNFTAATVNKVTFSGGTDGISAIPRSKSQLVRVTEHSALTQFEPRAYEEFPLTPTLIRSYTSFSSMFKDLYPLLPFSPVEYINIPVVRPKYLAFLGGFESGSRSYSINPGPGNESNLDNYDFYNLQPSGTIKSTLDSGLKYSVEQMSGKKPWFDSYEKYCDDIRSIAQEYSVIPEFRISSHIPYYVKDKGGNFAAKNNSIFELDGSDMVNWRSSLTQSDSRYEENFVNGYLVTDPLTEACKLQNENIDLKLQKINFKISGIKKLLPYNGFYPQERTIQLANLFNEYVDDNVGGGFFRFTTNQNGDGDVFICSDIPTGSNFLINKLPEKLFDLFSKNTVMPYFFAPGILYNTIKSGISVDFPAITASVEQLFNIKDSVGVDDSMSVFEEIPFSLNQGGLPDFTGSMIAQGFLNSRFPFESLIFPNLAIPYSNKIPAIFTGSLSSGSEIQEFFNSTLQGTLFNIKMDAHANPDKFYIDEYPIGRGWKRTVPFAYLKNDKIPNPSYSMAMSNFLAEIPKFFLQNSQMNVFRSSEVKNWKNFIIGKKYFLDLKMRKSKDLVMIESYNSEYHVEGDSIEKTMNGRYFGWPVNKTTGTFDDKQGVLYEEMRLMHNDPAYAPFTPPYFEGEAILRLELSASKETYNTVKELFRDIKVKDIFSSLETTIDTGSDAYKYKMSIEDCLTVFGVGKNKEVSFDILGSPNTVSDTLDLGREYWAISPKLETPVLDFSEQSFTPHTGTYWISDGYGRGMWSGYGKIPTGSKGIVLELAESFPLEKDLRYGRDNSKLTGSLLTQLGFKSEVKKIGQIADKKTISEAIVAIPFVDNPIEGITTFIDGHYFFSINQEIFDSQRRQVETNKLENGETSITRMIKLMKQYVLPPNLDFLTFYKNNTESKSGIEPFVMYIFEFTHDLDQQDLSDIWQGVMPKISIAAQKEEVLFGHDIGQNELFGENFQIPKDMRWMIFKAKKKAEWNYFALTEDISDDQRFRFNFANSEKAKTPEYSYNWPYDYFSLVELAKIDVSLEYIEKTGASATIDLTPIARNQFNIGNVIENKNMTVNHGKSKKKTRKYFSKKNNLP